MAVDRFPENPLLSPSDAEPSIAGWEVMGTYSCGSFEWRDKIWLLVRTSHEPGAKAARWRASIAGSPRDAWIHENTTAAQTLCGRA